jgi:hypothetical protein
MTTVSFDDARAIADAVLLEGYLLYPYRASAQKNRLRWQFGVLSPRSSGESDPWAAQTECLIEAPSSAAAVRVVARFLRLQVRTSDDAPPWDEGVERSVETAAVLGEPVATPFELPAGSDAVDGFVRRWEAISGVVRISSEKFDGPYPLWKLRVRVENTGTAVEGPREETLRRSLVAAHTLLGVSGGEFVSLLEPPEWARGAAQSCENLHTWPVLVGAGRRDVMLSSPIILYDYPAIAPESAGELFDGTEIDEILTLRTMALTESEKAEARATDARAAALIDRVDALPPEIMERLHGAVRSVQKTPWWDPGADDSVSPETDSVDIGGVAVAKGARVRLRPSLRGADAQDMFLAGREAVVEAVFFDVDGSTHLAVTLADDPAADLAQRVGRYRYFAPDEIEVLA